MAEFCLECWNELNGTNDKPDKYIITKDYLCEGCAQFKQVIIKEKDYFDYMAEWCFFPFIAVWKFIKFLAELICKNVKYKKK